MDNMRKEINYQIWKACENGDGTINNVLVLTKNDQVMLVPENIYPDVADNVRLATLDANSGFVGGEPFSENNSWILDRVEYCMWNIEQRRKKATTCVPIIKIESKK